MISLRCLHVPLTSRFVPSMLRAARSDVCFCSAPQSVKLEVELSAERLIATAAPSALLVRGSTLPKDWSLEPMPLEPQPRIVSLPVCWPSRKSSHRLRCPHWSWVTLHDTAEGVDMPARPEVFALVTACRVGCCSARIGF